MRDTSAYCECCGKRESVGQCVKGVVMCPCEIETTYFIRTTLICKDCKKCPVHCRCESCKCPYVETIGHDRDCIVRKVCKATIRLAKAKLELEFAELDLKMLKGETPQKTRL